MDGFSLVIDDGNGGRHVEKWASGVRFKRSAYGGDVDLTATLTLPRGTFTDLGPNNPVTLYDGRTGAAVWSGNAHQPGVTAGPQGEVYDLQAFGGAARLRSAQQGLGYIVRDIGIWERSGASTKGAQTTQEEVDEDTPALDVSANDGKTVSTAWQGEWITRAFKQNGLEIVAVLGQFAAGVTGANYKLQLRTGTGGTSVGLTESAVVTPGMPANITRQSGEISAGDNVAAFRVLRQTSSIVATDDHWFRFIPDVLNQVRLNIDGTPAVLFGSTYVFASEVARDMIGRGMAPGADPAKAVVVSGSDRGVSAFAIDTLDWLGGISMGDALEELRAFEPKLFWTLYGDAMTVDWWQEDNPRYVISARDGGVSHPGEEVALCNRVVVTWTDRRGREQTTVVTQTVPGLDYTRDAEPIDLPDGVGSQANATRVGQAALELYNDPPKAGTAVVRRRILDRWSGALVLPHEIMPGAMVVEQETGDSFRLTEVDVDIDQGAAVLTLGESVLPIESVIARLERKERRRRRRRKN